MFKFILHINGKSIETPVDPKNTELTPEELQAVLQFNQRKIPAAIESVEMNVGDMRPGFVAGSYWHRVDSGTYRLYQMQDNVKAYLFLEVSGASYAQVGEPLDIVVPRQEEFDLDSEQDSRLARIQALATEVVQHHQKMESENHWRGLLKADALIERMRTELRDNRLRCAEVAESLLTLSPADEPADSGDKWGDMYREYASVLQQKTLVTAPPSPKSASDDGDDDDVLTSPTSFKKARSLLGPGTAEALTTADILEGFFRDAGNGVYVLHDNMSPAEALAKLVYCRIDECSLSAGYHQTISVYLFMYQFFMAVYGEQGEENAHMLFNDFFAGMTLAPLETCPNMKRLMTQSNSLDLEFLYLLANEPYHQMREQYRESLTTRMGKMRERASSTANTISAAMRGAASTLVRAMSVSGGNPLLRNRTGSGDQPSNVAAAAATTGAVGGSPAAAPPT